MKQDLPKKELGQHWLKDKGALQAVCAAAELNPDDIVLEIGPGLGDLTRYLLNRVKHLVAVEIDKSLSDKLRRELNDPKLEIITDDILKFDLTSLPPGYKVVANIPYYLTSNLIRILAESANPPQLAVLLVQKEVAERIAAPPGKMSLLSVSAQYYFEPKLGQIVKAELFEPPPKVDSQIISLRYRQRHLFEDVDTKVYFRLVKAGFAGRRKMLRSSLAAGLNIDKSKTDELLKEAGISSDRRAQNLSLQDWHNLYKVFKSITI